MDVHERPAPLQPAEEVDLYCLECGYNLRGLAGDPRRCPECFFMNPVGDLLIPALSIQAQLKRMESPPAYSFALLLMATGGLLVPLIAPAGAGPLSMPCALMLLAPVLLWLLAVWRFAVSCQNQPGWAAALLRYYIFGGIMFAGSAACIGVFIAGVGFGLQSRVGNYQLSIGVGILLIVAGFVLVRFVRWSYRQARLGMEPLQRALAVRLARDMLRRQMTRSR
jgi:hypothetical protein